MQLPWALLAPVVGALVLAFGFFAPSWAMGQSMPTRTLNTLYMFFLLGSAVCIYLVLRCCGWWRRVCDRPWAAVVRLVLILSLATMLLDSGNVHTAWSDWKVSVHRYDSAMRARYESIRRAKVAGERHVRVKPINGSPASFFVADITSDPDHWRNKGAAKYFGVSSIRVDEGAP